MGDSVGIAVGVDVGEPARSLPATLFSSFNKINSEITEVNFIFGSTRSSFKRY
jgi:hypothetical protein